MRIAEVAFPLPLDRAYDYEVPPELAAGALPGARVRAPLGARGAVSGVIFAVRDGAPAKPLKPVAAVLDPRPLMTEELVGLARWTARRYCASLGECLRMLLPSDLRERRRALGASEGAWDAGPAEKAPPRAPFELTPGQKNAVEVLGAKLSQRRFSADLLFGVPASGKTEIYVRLIRQAVSSGGQALFMVPEISLTRPFFRGMEASLGVPVAVWHSQIGARARKDVWMGLRSGELRVVIGARSACLLPFKDLRLAVMDEEQDESYKQDGQAPYYHARDVVLHRGRTFGAVVVLGSATPSIEACALARRRELGLLRLAERVSKSTGTPPVRILDRPRIEGGSCLSPELFDHIKACLSRREQAILLVNRRGYSNFIICRKCGWVARCPVCSVAFIHHRVAARPARPAPEQAGLFDPTPAGAFPLPAVPGAYGPPGAAGAFPPPASDGGGFQLICHHCGRTAGVPQLCGKCGKGPLRFAGIGTQKVVSELRSRLPGVRVLRMDRDSVAKEKASEKGIYDAFMERKADILVGTKLVAKGFHFPDVTLVGVVDADTMLNMPDFRSAERTVQLLVQAAGRAGRAEKPGWVYLQTCQPEHYAIQAVARGDYEGFARQEIGFRGELCYPPSSTLIRVLLQGKTEEAVSKAADGAAEQLRSALDPADELLGPAPGVHAQLKGKFRFHLLLKVKEASRLEPVIEALRGLRLPSTVRAKVNVDPYDFF